MKKSGLADSPFFAPPANTEPTPPPSINAGVSASEDINLSQSPTILNTGETTEAQLDNKQDQNLTNVLSDVRTDERTDGRTDVLKNQKPKRQKIRHAFDIYQDQLMSLQMRQLEAVQRGKRKPKLGKMVQDAIDLYLKQSAGKK